MLVGVVGVNFRSASLEIREKLAKVCLACFGPTAFAARMPGTVLVSTCNRTEIYFSGANLAEMHTEIIGILREYMTEPFEQKLYSFFSAECFLHLCRVSSGLDSAILAETEIQQQLRAAYRLSSKAYVLSNALHFLFQKTFQIAKAARSLFPLQRGIPTLEGVIFDLIQDNITCGFPKKVLLIGYSQINRQLISFLAEREMINLTLCTRSMASAQQLTSEKNITLVGRDALESWARWDVVICATEAPDYLLKNSSNITEGKSYLLIDLSVPRLIEPSLGRHPMIHLINTEQVAGIVDRKRNHRVEIVDRVQGFLMDSVVRYMHIFEEKSARRYACA